MTRSDVIALPSLRERQADARRRHHAQARTLRHISALAIANDHVVNIFLTSQIHSFFIGIFTESDRARLQTL